MNNIIRYIKIDGTDIIEPFKNCYYITGTNRFIINDNETLYNYYSLKRIVLSKMFQLLSEHKYLDFENIDKNVKLKEE